MSSIQQDIAQYGSEFITYTKIEELSAKGQAPVVSLYKGKLYVYDTHPTGVISKICNFFRKMCVRIFYTLDFTPANINAKLTNLKAKLDSYQAAKLDNDKANQAYQDAVKKKEETEDKVDAFFQTRSKLETENQALKNENETLRAQNAIARQTLASFQDEMALNKTLLEEQLGAKKDLEGQVTELHSKVTKLDQECSEQEKKVAQLNAQIQEKQKFLQSLEASIKESQAKMGSLVKESILISNRTEELKKKFKDLTQQKRTLEYQLEGLKLEAKSLQLKTVSLSVAIDKKEETLQQKSRSSTPSPSTSSGNVSV